MFEIWCLPCWCLEGDWEFSEGFLHSDWWLSGGCLKGVWRVSGMWCVQMYLKGKSGQVMLEQVKSGQAKSEKDKLGQFKSDLEIILAFMAA